MQSIVCYDMANSSGKGKQKVLIMVKIVSLIDEDHSLTVVVSKQGIGRCTIISIKRLTEVTVVCYTYCVTHDTCIYIYSVI